MPEFLYPGVYIEEVAPGPRPIEGVPTSTAAFFGEAARGTLEPTRVNSYAEYCRYFGGAFGAGQFLPDAVNGFFRNGGERLYVCRIVGEAAVGASAELGPLTVHAVGPGTWGDNVYVQLVPEPAAGPETSARFKLVVAYYPSAPPHDRLVTGFLDERTGTPPAILETFDNLSVDADSPDRCDRRINGLSTLIWLGLPPGPQPGGSLVATIARLAGGIDDEAALGSADYLGAPSSTRARAQGLSLLERDPYREVALVYAPGVGYDIAAALVAHCEQSRCRFAVVDCERDMPLDFEPRDRLTDSGFAAFYYPWIELSDPETGARRLVPPGGHALGIFARTDNGRGVWKAPANEAVSGALALQRDTDDNLQAVLAPRGINVIRDVPGQGILLWGARTLSADGLWKYVNVRRLFIFLERSIDEGLQWVVFERNDDRLWARVIDLVRVFLRSQWRQGALAGRTEEEAFFIACDRTTMTQDDIDGGRLVCEIGVAPLRPAEFVILRLVRRTVGS